MAVVVRPSTVPSRRLASPALRSLMRRRTGELVGIGLGLTGLALLVALASHNPADPSLNTATTRGTSNLAGPPGAVVSDLLLQGFGLAGALPGIAMLAWAWRIASRRGIGSPAVRIVALLAAMPALGAVLAALPAPGHLAAIPWPTVAGPGGAVGRLLATAALDAGRPLLGAWAPIAIWPLGLVLALGLSLLTLGLSFGEWRVVGSVAGRTAGTAARHSFSGGRSAAGFFARASGGLGAVLAPVARLFRGRREEEATPPSRGGPSRCSAPRPPPLARAITRRPEPEIADEPPPPPEPRNRLAAMLDKRPAKPAKAPASRAKPEQISLPLAEGGWRFPPLSLLKPAPAHGAVGPSADALEAVARRLETVLADYGVQGRIVAYPRRARGHAVRARTRAGHPQRPRDRPGRRHRPHASSVAAVRIATVSGRNVIGIEVPNAKRETVYLQRGAGRRGRAEARGPAVAGARQGHRRRGRGRRPRPHAASDDRGHHRLGQVGRRQRHDPQPALPAVAGSVPADPDRPEDARAVGLRGHPASDGAGRHRTGQGRHRAEMDGARDGAALPRHEPARRAQCRRLQRPRGRGARQGRGRHPPRADRLRPRHRTPDLRGTAARARAAAVHRRRGRRNGRPDDGRRQGDRGRGAAPGADGPRRRHPCDHGDAAPVGGRHHRHHQGQLPDPDQLPGDQQVRQPHHPRRTGRRTAAGHGRHALHDGRRTHHPRARPVRLRPRSGGRRRLPARTGRARLCRGSHRSGGGRRLQPGAVRHRRGVGRRKGPVRPGRRRGRARRQGLHQLHPAPPATSATTGPPS